MRDCASSDYWSRRSDSDTLERDDGVGATHKPSASVLWRDMTGTRLLAGKVRGCA
jgi:hypothetical protein